MTLTAPPPREIAPLADALRPALLRLSRRLRNEGLKSGLSSQDAILLGLVKARPGIGVSSLADAEQTSRPTMSCHVKRLEAEGLLARDADADDGRRSGLSLTRHDWLATRLAQLEPAERERISAAAAALFKLASAD
jgi:DNA-binding MarR family transcriptional regulator